MKKRKDWLSALRTKRMLLLLPLMVIALANAMAQDYGYGVTVVMNQDDGQKDLFFNTYETSHFRPTVQNDEVVWSFYHNVDNSKKRVATFKNVETITFRSPEEDVVELHKALNEFYQAMDGDHWLNNQNWCSDKPLGQWYGVNEGNVRRITELRLTGLKGPLSESLYRLGPIWQLTLYGYDDQKITGEIPSFLEKMVDLQRLNLGGNAFVGTIPDNLANLPHLRGLFFQDNQLSGPLPEKIILHFMDNFNPYSFSISGNNFSGKVPKSISSHKYFSRWWPSLIIQNGPLDISDVTIPAPRKTIIDMNGQAINLDETYKKNKYTLLYKWGCWCSWSDLYNQKLIPAYNSYKEKGLEVIGLHYNEDEELADYIKENQVPWRNCLWRNWESEDMAALIMELGTPQVHLVDQNGNIVFTDLIDETGKDMRDTMYRDSLFSFLEKQLGPVEYTYYTSTDYSKDGEVSTLQKATTGKGVDLVFVGEGFTDKDIADGTFDLRMKEALEQFFKYEPYTSLRQRFNVYAVKAVSPNAEFMEGCKHAIDENSSKALEYASKVTTLIPNRPMRVNVIYNRVGNGRSFCSMFVDDNSYVCYAMEGVNDVLNHEAGGHGIGLLFDEYVKQGNESLTLPDGEKEALEYYETLGWGANVDWRSNPTEVKWAHFISDSRYADEQIGVYEGSYNWGLGVYRPTMNSMMRYNDIPFNAPSREEIYKRVMKESEGDGWTYDYETFVAFDASGHRQFVDALPNAARHRRASMTKRELHTAPPIFVKGTWRDVLKK